MRRQDEVEAEIVVAKRFGEIEKDRWGEGKGERNGVWPDGTPLLNL